MATGLAPLLLPHGKCRTSERTRLSLRGPAVTRSLQSGFLLNYTGLGAKMKKGREGDASNVLEGNDL